MMLNNNHSFTHLLMFSSLAIVNYDDLRLNYDDLLAKL